MGAAIGTAGWSIAAREADRFPAEGWSLERYAAVFGAVEINSSFHRPHRASTWTRWAQSVPEGFRFSVKMPKTISHEHRLLDCEEAVARFFGEAAALGSKLSVLLLQLPPRLAFDAAVAEAFFAHALPRAPARLACEPRHPSWFEPGADALLAGLGVVRVAADPAVVPAAALRGGDRSLAYWRLHGSPAMYRSAYGAVRLARYAALIRTKLDAGRDVWCMFDNTASSAATGDALDLLSKI